MSNGIINNIALQLITIIILVASAASAASCTSPVIIGSNTMIGEKKVVDTVLIVDKEIELTRKAIFGTTHPVVFPK